MRNVFHSLSMNHQSIVTVECLRSRPNVFFSLQKYFCFTPLLPVQLNAGRIQGLFFNCYGTVSSLPFFLPKNPTKNASNLFSQ